MKKLKRLIAVLSSAVILAGYTAVIPSGVSAEEISPHEAAAAMTASMPLRHKIAQMIMITMREWTEKGTETKLPTVEVYMDKIEAAVADGRIPESRINESCTENSRL